MMKLLALTALFTFVFALPAEIGKRQMETLPPGACIWDNDVYEHFDVISIDGPINCTSWICLNGIVFHDMTICGDIYGHCHDEGDVFSEGNCLFYECVPVTDTVSHRVFRYTGCGDIYGHCHDQGDLWYEGNCLIYECMPFNDTASHRVFSYTGCWFHGSCYGINVVFHYGNCQRYRCTLENNQPRMVRSDECQDHTGVCRHLGEWFPYHIGNIYHDNCTCEAINPARSISVKITCPNQ